MTGLLDSYGAAGQTYGGTGGYGGTATLAPVFPVEIESSPGVWEPVECDVRSIDLHRGRSTQLDQFTAATASIVLSDFADRYNAWHPSGIWSGTGTFRTGIGVRVSVVSGLTRTYLFVGTTDDVVDSWPGAGRDATTLIHCTDAFKSLARSRPTKLGVAVGAGELPGARMGRILDAVAYPGPRNLEAGSIALQATVLDGTAIALADETAESEYGAFYVDADGTIRLRARDSLTTDPRQSTVQWVFVDRDDVVIVGVGVLAATPPVLVEPFDNFTDAPWAVTNTPTIVAGRTGTALQAGSSVPRVDYTILAAAQSDTITMGFAWRRTDATTLKRHLFGLWSDGGTREHNRLTYTPSASLLEFDRLTTTIASATPITFTTNTWYYIEVQVKQADAPNGFVIVRIDGTTVINATGLDTRNVGTTGVYDTVRLWTSAASCTGQWDDLYIATGADQPFHGDITVPPGPPVSSSTPVACYSDLKLIASDDRVYNTATVTRGSGTTPQVATIADSVAWYGPRTYTRDLPINTDVGALTVAQTVVAQHAYNERRVDAIVLDPTHVPDAWPACIGVQLLDRIRVIRHTNVVIDAELQVQSIAHAITPGSWTVTLGTTNARTVRDAGQWDLGRWDEAKWSA